MRQTIRRGVLGLAAAAVLALGSVGCFPNQYHSDPNVRTDQLLNQSEDLRQVGEVWRRFWFNDMPSHMTPDRVHGGVM